MAKSKNIVSRKIIENSSLKRKTGVRKTTKVGSVVKKSKKRLTHKKTKKSSRKKAKSKKRKSNIQRGGVKEVELEKYDIGALKCHLEEPGYTFKVQRKYSGECALYTVMNLLNIDLEKHNRSLMDEISVTIFHSTKKEYITEIKKATQEKIEQIRLKKQSIIDAKLNPGSSGNLEHINKIKFYKSIF
jgi:hypothetical protein